MVRVSSGRLQGGQIHDVRMAAICAQHEVKEFWSADRDFSRIGWLRVVNPLIQC